MFAANCPFIGIIVNTLFHMKGRYLIGDIKKEYLITREGIYAVMIKNRAGLKKFKDFLFAYLILLLIIFLINVALLYSIPSIEFLLSLMGVVALYWVVLFVFILVIILLSSDKDKKSEEDYQKLREAIEIELDRSLKIKGDVIETK